MPLPWTLGTIAVVLLVTVVKVRHEASMRKEDFEKAYVTVSRLHLRYQSWQGPAYEAKIQEIQRIKLLKNGKVRITKTNKRKFTIPAIMDQKDTFLWELRRLGPVVTPNGTLTAHPDAMLFLKDEASD